MFGKKQKHRRKTRRKSARISEPEEKNEEMRQLFRNGGEIKLIRLLEVL